MQSHLYTQPTNHKKRRLRRRISSSLVLLILFGLSFAFGNHQGTRQAENAPKTTPPIIEPQPPIADDVENYEENEDEIIQDEEPEYTTITMQFVGDVFMHGGPIQAARTGDFTFDFKPFLTHIRPYINADLAIANMEVPVDARGGNRDVAGWPNFNTPFEILEAVQYAGFNHMVTANNHSFDFGLEGLLNTVNSFERAGLLQTGMNTGWGDYNTPTVVDVNGIKVGILSYTDSVNGLEHLVPEASRAYAVRRFTWGTLNDIPRMTDDMNAIREAGAEIVIVALHWGAEYGDEPIDMQRTFGRALVDAGADIIMGKHSHTVHPVEWHTRPDGTEGFIMYSLGNFLADQTRLFPNATGPNDVLYTGWNAPIASNFAGRTQFGMIVGLSATRDADGVITLGEAEILPTLTMRDFTGNTLGIQDHITVLPLIDKEVPEFITEPDVRNWGRVAYEHVNRVVGSGIVPR